LLEFKHPDIGQSLDILKIMIVDDNVVNLFVLKSQLLKMNENFNIVQAHNGKLALEQFCLFNQNKTDTSL